MPFTQEAELADVDAEGAIEAAREAGGDGVRSFVGFTAEDVRTLHVDDGILSMYRDESHLNEYYEQVLDRLNVDFLEREAYEKTLLPNAGRVRSIVARMEELTLLRVLYEDSGFSRSPRTRPSRT